MNWKVKMVLLFSKFRKFVSPEDPVNVKDLRRLSDKVVKLGLFLFDKKTDIKSVENYKTDGVPVRIYNDHPEAKNQRVMMYYHGGGFVLYDLDSHDLVCRRLCKMNRCIVVSVDYRLAPEHQFPVAHEDAFKALKWTIKNIEDFGGNPNDIVLAGDSAGATISACLAHRCKKENIALKAQILVYPWVDGKLTNPSLDRNGKGYLLEKKNIVWYQHQYTPKKEDHLNPEASPIYESDFSNLAPALILTAELDPLYDDGVMYFEKLKSAGNKVRYENYAGMFHGFFNLPYIHKNAMKAYTDIQDFLKEI